MFEKNSRKDSNKKQTLNLFTNRAARFGQVFSVTGTNLAAGFGHVSNVTGTNRASI